MVEPPRVRDRMTHPEMTLEAADPMREAIQRVSRTHFPAIPVLAEDGRLVGLLTEKDALRTIGLWAYEGLGGASVGDHMSPVTVSLTPDMDLLAALCAFLECHFVCLPVVEGERLVGCLHRHDVLRGLIDWTNAIDADREERMSRDSEHERPTAIESMQQVAATHTRDQLMRIFGR